MSMNSDVVKFIKACDQKPSNDSVNLYTRLIEEEYNEFLVARDQDDEVEQLDACMDMIWVILGYCYAKGYNVEGAWGEVAKSNLCKIDQSTGKVKKRHDGKVLKPDGWQEPNLTPFILT